MFVGRIAYFSGSGSSRRLKRPLYGLKKFSTIIAIRINDCRQPAIIDAHIKIHYSSSLEWPVRYSSQSEWVKRERDDEAVRRSKDIHWSPIDFPRFPTYVLDSAEDRGCG